MHRLFRLFPRHTFSKRALLLASLILIPLLVGSGCASDEEKKAKHMARARQYATQGQYKDAVIEFKNALQRTPGDGSIYFELGETYMKLNEVDAAARAYADAIRRRPDLVDAHLRLGKILISARRTLGARIAAKSVLDKEPENIDALQLLAAVQIQENNLAGAIQTLQSAAKADPGRQKPRLFLAEVLAFSGDTDAAERTYLQSISIDPANLTPYIKLARLYGDKGLWDRILAVLNQFEPRAGQDFRSMIDLARYCEANGQWAIAEKLLNKAVAMAPADEIGALVALGAHFGRKGDHDQALTIMQQALAIRKNDPAVLANIANLHIEKDQLDAARMAADRALALDAEDPLANYARGRIYFLNQDFVRALPLFEQTIGKDPKNAMAYYYKALCQLGKGMRGQSDMELFRAAAGQYDDEDAWVRNLALANLHLALELDPGLLKVRLVLADIYLGLKDAEKAREQIEAALALAPGYLKTVTLLGSLKLLEKDYEGAVAVCRKVLEKRPELSVWHARLGIVYAAMDRLDEALASYQRALDLDPAQFSVIKSMAAIHLRKKDFQGALAVCDRVKEKVAENRSLFAQIETLQGDIFRARGDMETAIRYLKNAAAVSPTLIAPRMALAEIHAGSGRVLEAIGAYEGVLELDSEYLPACMALGTIHYRQGDRKKAEKYYRKALSIQPGHGPAANNLAFLLSDNEQTLHEAYRLAQLAEKKMPRDASVKDTLGWLYYRVGDYDQAISLLKKSLALDPDDAQANYHLGLAYYQSKDFTKAWQYLKKALSIDPHFEGADDARALLD